MEERRPELVDHLNRQQRRAQHRRSNHAISPEITLFEQAHHRFHQGEEQWMGLVKSADTVSLVGSSLYSKILFRLLQMTTREKLVCISPILFREEPVLFGHADTIRTFSNNLAVMRSRHPDYPNLHTIEPEDVYSTTFQGVSLRDIEVMPLPLSEADIRRINRMVAAPKIWDRTVTANVAAVAARARQILVYLPTQVLVREGEMHLSSQLEPLFKRQVAYLDHFMPYVMDPTVALDKQYSFIKTIIWMGSLASYLVHALGGYIPARSGLTPSSVEKKYLEHETAPYASSFRPAWEFINGVLRVETRTAYRVGVLPRPLEGYKHFDPYLDQKAAKLLEGHYLRAGLADRSTPQQDPNQLLERFNLYKRVLRSDTLSSKDKLLRYKFENHPTVDQVVITSQNRRTVMLILLFKDGQTHLTLEIDQDNKLYGVPPALLRDYPHVPDLLIAEILGTVLESVAKQHPEIEPKKVSRERIQVEAKPEPIKMMVISTSEIEEDEERQERLLRKRFRVPMVVLREPEPPKAIETSAPKYRVRHTRADVESYFGKKQIGAVDRVMEAILRFELGQKSVTAVEDASGLLSLRVGDRRVILQSLGGIDWSIYTIGLREWVYKRI